MIKFDSSKFKLKFIYLVELSNSNKHLISNLNNLRIAKLIYTSPTMSEGMKSPSIWHCVTLILVENDDSCVHMIEIRIYIYIDPISHAILSSIGSKTYGPPLLYIRHHVASSMCGHYILLKVIKKHMKKRRRATKLSSRKLFLLHLGFMIKQPSI